MPTAADHADLVLNLSLLPARGGRAGHRLDAVMTAHLLEPTIVGAVATHEDRVDRGLHVVVDAAHAGPLEEGKSPVMGVEDHLLGLARITDDREPGLRGCCRY